MRTMGPMWALAITLDRNLFFLLLSANLLFAAAFTRISFRDRRPIDQALVLVAVFTLLTATSVLALHWFAKTPVREVQFFAID